MSKICLRTEIHAPRQLVFDLARNIDLHTQSSKSTQEQAISGVTSGLIGMGETVTWRAKHFGIWQLLTVTITDFEPPSMFADQMVRGAFQSMRHVHRFEPLEKGTVMVDEFEFTAPFWILGTLADRLFLHRYMRRFLLDRNVFLKVEAERRSELFGS